MSINDYDDQTYFYVFVVDVIIVVSISGGAFAFLENIRSKIPALILNHNSKYVPPIFG